MNYVEVGDLDVPGDQITVEALVTQMGPGLNIVSKHTTTGDVNYLLRPDGVEITTTTGYVDSPLGITLNTGECYHLAFTYNGNTLDYYVNGCLTSSVPHTGDMIQNDWVTAIGDQSSCQCESWNGYIDEVRIWNVVRSQADIQANMYDLPTPGAQAGLLAYYKFDGDYVNLQGNATWDGYAVGAPQFQTDPNCQGADLSFQANAVVTDVTCPGGNDGTVTFNCSGGHPEYSFSVDGVNYFAVNPVTGLPAGTATVYARSGIGGCVIPIQVTINEPDPIVLDLVGTDVSCSGGNDGAIELTVYGGTPPYNFSWSNGSNLEDPTGLSAGNHTVDVTDANGCTASASIILTEPPPVSLTMNTTYVSGPGMCDGSATANPINGVPPFDYSWSSGSTTQTATGLCEGAVTVTVTDANGCIVQQTVNIEVPACLTDVDFNTWQQAGVTANGDWQIQNGGAQVEQFINGNPTFYVTPNDFINVKMNGVIRSNYTSDDDYIGFVFGFIEPMGQTDYYDLWLFDWKNGLQLINGYTSEEGFALSRALGTIPIGPQAGGVQQAFFGHENIPAFTVVDSQFGAGNGWTHNFDHQVSLIYTLSRAIMIVDGDTIFDHSDCFQPGRFGFYNYSQQNVIYSQFTYELFVDFDVLTPQVCTGDTAKFQFYEECGGSSNLSQFDELHWNFGDGSATLINSNPTIANVNPDHIYANPGTYSVELIAMDQQGCRDTVSHNITVYERPTAEFSFSDTCFGEVTQFADASTQGDLAITSWAYEFGDGATSTAVDPTNAYGAWGVYNAQLIVEDAFGCKDTSIHTVNIHEPPVAAFTPIEDCLQPNYPFEDQSSANDGVVDDWQWDFGDLGTSILQNPTHSYVVYGNYDVQLIVETDLGCSDTVIQTVIFHELPTVDFLVPPICQLSAFNLTDQSSVTDGILTDWFYEFEPGGTSNTANPSYTYVNSGPASIQLTVTTSHGCIDSTTIAATVNPKPLAEFNFINACDTYPISFNDQSSVVSGSVDDWTWNFGDLSTDSVQDPSHLYAAPGTYPVNLIVATDQGCLDTVAHTVEVYNAPVADFSFADNCLMDLSTFTDQSSSISGFINSWNWSFGDTETSIGEGPQLHQYDNPGSYNVQLIISSQYNCLDTSIQEITVHPLPEADFIADSVCFGQATSFTDMSTILTGSINSYSWVFEFGQSSSDINPTHIFSQTGYHSVGLTLTSDQGCKDTLHKDIRVYVLPEPEFAHNDTCDQDSVQFINLSQISEGSIDFYNWNFGDSFNSTDTAPAHQFPIEGYYLTELVATSNYGCLDSISHQIEIYPLPQASFYAQPQEGCQPLEVDFVNTSSITFGYSSR